jgi:preprotein translocase subunit SecG
MLTLLKYFQVVVSILLIISILLQSKSDGFSPATFSGANSVQTKKRGAEKVIFNATIVLAILFVLSSLAFIFVK